MQACFSTWKPLHYKAKGFSFEIRFRQFFQGVFVTRFGSLELKIGSLESEKIIKGNI